MHAGLGHQVKEPRSLERYGLAPGVRARDEQGSHWLPGDGLRWRWCLGERWLRFGTRDQSQMHVNRDYPTAKQWMPSTRQVEGAISANFRMYRIERQRISSACDRQIY